MSEKQESWVLESQTKLIGPRFAGASLCNARGSKEDLHKINEWAKKKSGMLIMMGNPGCGKTWDCSAIWSWMHGKVGDMYYYRESDFLSRLRAVMNGNGEWQQEIIYLLDHDLIILDDIGSAGQGQTGWRQDVFFIASNNRYESKKPTVFSTNYNEAEIKEKLGFRAHSRLFAKENTIIDMFGYPDIRQES